MLGSFVSGDDVERVHDGHGIHFSIGWSLTEALHLQLGTSYINFDTDAPTTDFYRSAVGIELVRYFDAFGLAPYVVAGIGAAYNDVDVAALDGTDFTASAGVGLLSSPFTRYGIRVRSEARYVHDRFLGRPEDVHYAVGLMFPLRTPRTIVHTEIKEIVKVVHEPAPPLRDTDQDGVPDERDACADTLPRATVDARGCMPVQAVVQLTGVHFDYDASRLTENSKTILAMAAASLRGQSGMRVEVAGHTDDRGPDHYNLELSRRRAQAVTEYLSALGIAASRMQARGYGESQPMDTNDTDSGRERNRRVEFRVLSN